MLKTLQELENERNKQPIHKTVKLPCGHATIELTKTGDQYIKCSICHKSFLLTWSSIGRHKMQHD